MFPQTSGKVVPRTMFMSQEKDLGEFEDGLEVPDNKKEEGEDDDEFDVWGNKNEDDDLELVTDRIKDNLLEEDVM